MTAALEIPHPHEDFVEIADRVFVRRHRFFDSNSTLIVGDGGCLVIDTRTTGEQGADLAAAVRHITAEPWVVVNTHHHFDHVFGNSAFLPCDIWGHERCAETIRKNGEATRARVIGQAHAAERSDIAEQLANVVIHPPNKTLDEYAELHIGGREIQLHYLGRGHTDNDLVIVVPDAGVVHAGDLVEEGGPPSFNDSFPLDWVETMSRIGVLDEDVVVPGHGAVVDQAFVTQQAQDIAVLVRLARAVHDGELTQEDAVSEGPFVSAVNEEALQRALAQLGGEL